MQRSFIRLSVFGLLATVALQAQQLQKLPGGLEFRSPAQWEARISGGAAVLLPPDTKLMPDKSPAELYIVSLLEGIKDLADPRMAALLEGKYLPGGKGKLVGPAKPFKTSSGGNSSLFVYEFQEQGINGRLEIYAVEFSQGAVAALIAIGMPNLIAARSTAVSALASSLSLASRPARTDDNSALVSQWDRRLRGKKMVQMSSYNGGASGGTNSQRTLSLFEDGTYSYRSSSSVSIYVDGANGGSSGQKSDAGEWRLYESSGNVMLETKSTKGEVSSGVLTLDGTKTLLNNVRWFVVGMNE